MKGQLLLEELAARLRKKLNKKRITDADLARELGVTQPNIQRYRKQGLTPKQMLNLMARAKKQAVKESSSTAIRPIIEFLYIDPIESRQGAAMEIFSTSDGTKSGKHPYLEGLKKRLSETRGIYIFHDSRGRAIYAGRTTKQTLWKEINSVFNRDRKSVQSIKRVNHPQNRIAYKDDDGTRVITKCPVELHEIASYLSAYEVAPEMIGDLEALLVRSFANELLNVRSEKFGMKTATAPRTVTAPRAAVTRRRRRTGAKRPRRRTKPA